MSETKWKAGTGLKIEKLYAWVAEEPDGGEGIIAGLFPGHDDVWMPLIGADRDRIESYRNHAQAVARETGYPVRLKVFGAGVTIEEA